MTSPDGVVTLEESVYLGLREEILSGGLEKGYSLTESQLCAKYGASRTPVRAALHRLSEDGLVNCVPNKGAVVIGVDKEQLFDIYQIRMRLEGLASSLAAKRMNAQELSSLVDIVELSEHYASKRDAENLKQLDSRFHETIYRASGNSMLERTLRDLHRMIKFYRKKSLSTGERLYESVAEHREILEAIRNKDPELADTLTNRHIERAMENMAKTLS